MQQNYIKLLSDVGEKEFNSRFAELQKQVDEFLGAAGYISETEETVCVECNDRILYHVLLDYYSDIQRLKEFHQIKHTKTDKNIAYLAYWILKRKPIQVTNAIAEDKDIFINERFVCYIITYECIQVKSHNLISRKLDEQQKKIYEKYIDLLLYFLKYRECTPQMLELLIETFKMGIVFGEATEKTK